MAPTASRIARGALWIAAIAAAIGVGLRLYMEQPEQNRLLPGEDVAIADLRGRLPANASVACPPDYCRVAGAARSPVFPVAVDRLHRDLVRVIASEPRVTPVAEEPRRIVVIQRSAVFGFPDIAIAELIALGPDRSSVALYSRARYGRDDFGVNRARVERWLAGLAALTRPQ